MGKITFRADDDLVDELEAFDASKSEVMRAALRTYLDGQRAGGSDSDVPENGSAAPDHDAHADAADDPDRIESLVDERIDAVVRRRVDEVVRQRVDDSLGRVEQDSHPHPDERVPPRDSRTDDHGHAAGGRSVAVDHPGAVHLTVSLDGVEVAAEGSATGETAAPERTGDASVSEARPNAEETADAGAAERDGTRRPDPSAGTAEAGRRGEATPSRSCGQCGTAVDPDHVHCPNCGEKVTRRVFCECGDEVRSDWAFCPGCGRRTAAADVLDSR